MTAGTPGAGDARTHYVVAADIGGTRVRMALADLRGHMVAEWNTHIAEDEKSPPGVVRLLRHGADAMCARTGISREAIVHITAGAPGITGVDRGVVLAAPALVGWTDVPLRKLLEDEFGTAAAVDNDTNLAAVGEHAAGVAHGADNFIFVAMGTGAGAGIFLRGALHRGANWSAGEIGYLPVTGMPRPAVRMHERGQLEQAIGGLGIEVQWRSVLGPDSSAEWQNLRAPQIFDLAEAGNIQALAVLDYTAQTLADALGTMALLLDPELIVLGGGVGSHPALCAATSRYLRENDFAQPVLRSSSLGTQAQLFGGIAVSLAALDKHTQAVAP